jgi:hypothetical protein
MVGAVAGTPGTLPTNWTSSGPGTTIEIIGTGTEDGIRYIDLRFTGTVTNTNVNFETAVAAASGQSWTGSCYFRLLSGSLAGNWRLACNEFSPGYLRTGLVVSVASASSDPLKSQRITGSFVVGASTTSISVLLNGIGTGQTIDFTLRIGMPQLEQGGFATSVIPTAGTTVTRAADLASISGNNFSSWYNQSEGTFFANVVGFPISSGQFPRIFEASDGTTSNLIRSQMYGSNTVRNNVSAGGTVTMAQDGGTIAAGISGKTAFGVAENNCSIVTNGGTPSVDNTVTVPNNLNQIGILGTTGGVSIANSTIKRFTYWPQRLPNDTLKTITT